MNPDPGIPKHAPYSGETLSGADGPAPSALWAAWDALVLERRGSGEFFVSAPPPAWATASMAAPFPPEHDYPFLETFLETDARALWADTRDGVVHSGPWTQPGTGGIDMDFRAVAIRWEGRAFLILRRTDMEMGESRRILQHARDRAFESERLLLDLEKREDFLRCVVHDIGSPLASVESAMALFEPELPPDLQPLAASARMELRRQRDLLGQLLVLYRGEESRDWIGDGKCDPTEAARAALAIFQPVLALTGAPAPTLEIESGAPTEIRADPAALRRVLVNLVENAMRHSSPGSAVEVRLVPDGTGLRIEVCDRGSGVEPAVRDRLFQRFVRSGRTGGRAGIGLYFCRICAEKWGGTIGCQNREGGGSVFWLRLPAAAAGDGDVNPRSC